MEPMIESQVRHLYEVEHLSIRQIAKKLRMARKTVDGFASFSWFPGPKHFQNVIS
jgi:hypothetical protein